MRIMVPLDGSSFGEHAIPLALAIARARDGSLDLVHVHEPASMVYLEGVPQLDASIELEQLEGDRSYLGRARARLSERGVPVATTLLDGPTIPALRDHAEASGASLIVMSTHGRGPLSRAWLGSIADGLARHAPVPVLLIRPAERTEERAVVTAGADPGTASAPRHALLPLDGSPQPEAAIEPTLRLVGTGARATLLHVVPPSVVVGGHVFNLDEPDLDKAVAAARQQLEPTLERARALGADAQLDVLVGYDVADQIHACAERVGADLVALSTRARGGLSRLLFGSVTDKVLRTATHPVLVVPPTE